MREGGKEGGSDVMMANLYDKLNAGLLSSL